MRPKSRATVVVVLPDTAEVSSIPIDRSVISASVTSGSISEIAPTKVVLPTPNPPLMTILTATGGNGAGSLERPNTIPDPLDQCDGKLTELLLDPQVAVRHQVGDDDPDHAERHLQRHRQVRDGHRRLAQLDDAARLETQGCRQRGGGRVQQGLDPEP